MSIFAAHRGLVVTDTRPGTITSAQAHAAWLELTALGYLLPLSEIATLSPESAAAIISQATAAKGHVVTEPLFPGFPRQVEESHPLLTCFVNQVHYLHTVTGGEIPSHEAFLSLLPSPAPRRASEFLGHVTIQPLTLSTPHDLSAELARSTAELSPADERLLHNLPVSVLAGQVPYIRHDRVAAQFMIALGDDLDLKSVLSEARSPDRVLSAVLSRTGEPATAVTLDKVGTPLPSFPRSTRRDILRALTRTTRTRRNFDRLVARRRLWKTILRSLHAGDHVHLFNGAEEMYQILNGNRAYRTLASETEHALAEGNYRQAMYSMIERGAGVLYRGALNLWRTDPALRPELSAALVRLAPKVSPRVIVSLHNSVQAGEAGTMITTSAADNFRREREAFTDTEKEQLTAVCLDALRLSLAGDRLDLPVDRTTTGGNVVLHNRDAAQTSMSLSPGERLALPDGGRVRLYASWHDRDSGRVDLDLGVALLDKDFQVLEVIDYTNYHGKVWTGATHSGDVTCAPQGAVEYVDLDRARVRSGVPAARYAVMTLVNFNGQLLKDIDANFGAMPVSSADGMDGQLFQPDASAVSSGTDAASTVLAPLAYDLDTHEVVWVNASSGSRARYHSASDIIDMLIGDARTVLDAGMLSVEMLLDVARRAGHRVTYREAGEGINAQVAVERLLAR